MKIPAQLIPSILLCLISLYELHWNYVTLERRLPARDDKTTLDSSPNEWIVPNQKKVLPSKSRFLLGIFSVAESEKEKIRRDTIRRTYLSFYQNQTVQKICLLEHLLDNRRGDDLSHCQIVYVFIAAGITDPMAPKMRMKEPLLVENTSNETDIVLLNIAENMNEGKTPTFFKYASTLLDDDYLGIDYVIKTDSDTIVSPEAFLRQMEQFNITKTNSTAVYAGFPYNINSWFFRQCGPQSPFHAGMFYILSSDLVQYVVSDDCDRDRLTFNVTAFATNPICRTNIYDGAEDMSMGNYVHSSHNHTIRFVKLGRPEGKERGRAIRHAYKDPLIFENQYYKMIRELNNSTK
jgi:hypothetical protein